MFDFGAREREREREREVKRERIICNIFNIFTIYLQAIYKQLYLSLNNSKDPCSLKIKIHGRSKNN